MVRNVKQRVLVGRVATAVMTAAGMMVGYLLGCAFALNQGTDRLVQYAKLVEAQDDSSLAEARGVLTVLKDSPYPFCSDSEIAYFRGLVFRSQYLKDAGRVRHGGTECSAAAGHSAQSFGLFKPALLQADGTIAYSNVAPIKDVNLNRAALQLGSAYVVFGATPPPSPGSIPMRLSITPRNAADSESDSAAGSTALGKRLNSRTIDTGRVGNTLYVTSCSALHNNCVTASTTDSQIMHFESDSVTGVVIIGGLLGILFGMAFSSAYTRERTLDQQLRQAVERDELRSVYQPIVDLSTHEIVGAEVLSRWSDEAGNPVQPDVFIKIAEKDGFIGSITRSTLQHALHDFAATLRKRPGFRISINLSAADLADPAFPPFLEETLRRANINPHSLVMEITERSAADSQQAMETIRNLRRAGHSIHIDDFGTGYSNLDKLLCLSADTIKIDKAFTKVIGTQSIAAAILPQILTIAKSLNLEVVVEGVETVQQADYFSPGEQKIFAQGWLYGRPVAAEQFQALLDAGRTAEIDAPDALGAFRTGPGSLHVVRSLVA